MMLNREMWEILWAENYNFVKITNKPLRKALTRALMTINLQYL